MPARRWMNRTQWPTLPEPTPRHVSEAIWDQQPPRWLDLRWPNCAGTWMRSFKDRYMNHPAEPRPSWQSMETEDKFWVSVLFSSNWKQVLTKECSRYPSNPKALLNSCYASSPTATTGAMQKPKYQTKQVFLQIDSFFKSQYALGTGFPSELGQSLGQCLQLHTQDTDPLLPFSPWTVFIPLALSIFSPVITLFPWLVQKTGLEQSHAGLPQ